MTEDEQREEHRRNPRTATGDTATTRSCSQQNECPIATSILHGNGQQTLLTAFFSIEGFSVPKPNDPISQRQRLRKSSFVLS
jgi:hypothetical protein